MLSPAILNEIGVTKEVFVAAFYFENMWQT